MELNIERLEVDAEYWDEVAPEGATHFNAHDTGSRWWMQDGQCMYERKGQDWRERLLWPKSLIPRPTKQEWEGGLPPVNESCLISNKNDDRLGESEVKIVCYTSQLVIVANDVGTEYAISKDLASFRPLKSQQDRQREELISIIEDTGRMREEDTADAILSRYILQEKQ